MKSLFQLTDGEENWQTTLWRKQLSILERGSLVNPIPLLALLHLPSLKAVIQPLCWSISLAVEWENNSLLIGSWTAKGFSDTWDSAVFRDNILAQKFRSSFALPLRKPLLTSHEIHSPDAQDVNFFLQVCLALDPELSPCVYNSQSKVEN